MLRALVELSQILSLYFTALAFRNESVTESGRREIQRGHLEQRHEATCCTRRSHVSGRPGHPRAFAWPRPQVESLHAHISAARAAHLAELRRRGDERDPFLEADRREEAARQAEENRRKAAQAALLAAQPQQPATATAGLQHAQAAAQQVGSGTTVRGSRLGLAEEVEKLLRAVGCWRYAAGVLQNVVLHESNDSSGRLNAWRGQEALFVRASENGRAQEPPLAFCLH